MTDVTMSPLRRRMIKGIRKFAAPNMTTCKGRPPSVCDPIQGEPRLSLSGEYCHRAQDRARSPPV